VSDPRAALGARGELLAAVVYVLLGHRILGRRVVTPPAEVDLVCRRGHDLVLVEVKRRRVAPTGVPSLTSWKSSPTRRSVTNRHESPICWELADALMPMPLVRNSSRSPTVRRSSIHA